MCFNNIILVEVYVESLTVNKHGKFGEGNPPYPSGQFTTRIASLYFTDLLVGDTFLILKIITRNLILLQLFCH